MKAARADHEQNLASRLLKEPLVHFLLIGVGLFALSYVSDEAPGRSRDRIVVNAGQVEQMTARFKRTWMRPPTDAELAGLIETQVRDEIYYREAVAMGLDRNDPTMRQRMRLKLEFLLEDLSAVAEPGDEVLDAYLAAHREKFRSGDSVSFLQVYFNPAERPDVATDAKRALADLKRGAASDSVGDPTLLEGAFRRVTPAEIERQFGAPFALKVLELEKGDWAGPLHSGLGVHLVKVTERAEGRVPELAEIRALVEREYLAQRRLEMKETAYRRLRRKYEVIVPPPATVGEPARQVSAAGPNGGAP